MKPGLLWEMNPGPLAPKARIIPLDITVERERLKSRSAPDRDSLNHHRAVHLSRNIVLVTLCRALAATDASPRTSDHGIKRRCVGHAKVHDDKTQVIAERRSASHITSCTLYLIVTMPLNVKSRSCRVIGAGNASGTPSWKSAGTLTQGFTSTENISILCARGRKSHVLDPTSDVHGACQRPDRGAHCQNM